MYAREEEEEEGGKRKIYVAQRETLKQSTVLYGGVYSS